MAMVDLNIGGRVYQVACKDGEEEILLTAGRLVDAKARAATNAMGTMSEARQFLFAALMMADEMIDKRPEAAPRPVNPELGNRVNAFADRLEALADQLENGNASA